MFAQLRKIFYYIVFNVIEITYLFNITMINCQHYGSFFKFINILIRIRLRIQVEIIKDIYYKHIRINLQVFAYNEYKITVLHI